MDIRKCISELLTTHDCVILPGFGGFIGNYAPAHIDPVHHTFSPPYKKLLFNVNLKQNDGLLANCIADAEGMDYPDAFRHVREFVEECRHALKSGQSFVIPGAGRLFTGREGTVQFEQDKKTNLLPESFGLSSFISPPILRNSYQTRLEKSISMPGMNTGDKKSSFSRSLKWAAILAIPIGVAVVFGLSRFDKLNISPVNDAGILGSVFSRFSSTALVEKKEAPATVPETEFLIEPTPSVFDSPITKDKAEPAPAQIVEKKMLNESVGTAEKQVSEEAPPVQMRDPYAVIIGAFRIRENAVKFVKQLKAEGSSASIFDQSKTGLFRVALRTFSSRNEAEQLLAQAKSGEFSGAWLLVK